MTSFKLKFRKKKHLKPEAKHENIFVRNLVRLLFLPFDSTTVKLENEEEEEKETKTKFR